MKKIFTILVALMILVSAAPATAAVDRSNDFTAEPTCKKGDLAVKVQNLTGEVQEVRIFTSRDDKTRTFQPGQIRTIRVMTGDSAYPYIVVDPAKEDVQGVTTYATPYLCR